MVFSGWGPYCRWFISRRSRRLRNDLLGEVLGCTGASHRVVGFVDHDNHHDRCMVPFEAPNVGEVVSLVLAVLVVPSQAKAAVVRHIVSIEVESGRFWL